jgi:hypothetical protein
MVMVVTMVMASLSGKDCTRKHGKRNESEQNVADFHRSLFSAKSRIRMRTSCL